jgi:hypothetical protein
MKVDPSDGVVPEKPNERLFRFRQPVVVEALQLEKSSTISEILSNV